MFESVIWIVPVAVAAAGLWRPRAGLLVLAARLPFFGSAPGGPYLAALDIAGLAAVAMAWRPGWRDGRVERSSLDWPVAAWVVVSVVSLVPFAYHLPSWQPSVLVGLLRSLPEIPTATVLHTWRALLNLLLGWGLYRAVRRTFVGESLNILGAAFGVGLAVALVFGLAEHAGLVDLGSYRAIGGPLYETRLHSFFFHSGWFAEYVVVALPFAVASTMVGGARRRRLGLALLVLALVALPFTEQRGAWFAALAQLAVLASFSGARLLRDRRGLWPIVTVALGVVAVGSVLMISRPETASPLLNRLGESTANLSGRPHLWSVSARMLAERPLLGWGLGAFAPAYDLVHPRGSTEAWPYRDTSHSLYFHVGAERGLLGLLALGVLVCALVIGFRYCVKSNRHSESAIAVGLLISAVGFAVNGLVQYMFYLRNIEWLFWIFLGAASLLSGSHRPRWLDRIAQMLIIATVMLLPWRAFWLEAIPGPGDRSFGFHWSSSRATVGTCSGPAVMRRDGCAGRMRSWL